MTLLEGRDLAGVVNGEGVPRSIVDSDAHASYATRVRKARAIIVNVLGDKPLRAVQLCTMLKEHVDQAF